MTCLLPNGEFFRARFYSRFLRIVILGALGMLLSISAQAQTVAVDYGDYWKFNIPTVDPGIDWRGLGFDDGVALNGVNWGTGPGLLGFETAALPSPGLRTAVGVSGSAPMVYLFRKTFLYSGPTSGTTFSISQIVDDGVTYYLNGTRLGSVRHTPGAWNNAALTGVGDAVEEFTVLSGPASGLVSGTNVLSAEVHQIAASGSDMIFGARLMINTAAQDLNGWRMANFSTTNNSGNAADLADPDGDKLANLVEYALCQDPNRTGTGWGTPRIEGTNLTLTYRRRTAALNAWSFSILWASDLNGPWSSSGLADQILGDDGTSQWIKAQVPLAGTAKKFIKVQVGPPMPPNPPTNLVVTANSDSQITLSWDDNSSDESGFEILRSVNGGSFSFLTSVLGDIHTYRDAGLLANATYSYQVRSMNGVGASAYTSATATQTWSEPASMESFEGSVPSYLTATNPNSLTVSSLHRKHANSSLRWGWTQGEDLIIRHGIGNVSRTRGFLNKASFVVWLYSETVTPGSLVFEFREGSTVTGSFTFPLGFTGWRQARIFYDQFPSGRPTGNVDNIRVVSPSANGAVYFDSVWFNALTYPSAGIDPVAVANQPSLIPDYQQFPKPTTVTQAELAGISVLAPAPPSGGGGVAETRVNDLCNQVNALGIVSDASGVRGPGVDGKNYYCGSVGEFGFDFVRYWPDERGPDGPVIPSSAPMISLATEVAKAHLDSNDATQRSRLAPAFLLLADHLLDQGESLNSDSFKWMREVLGQTTRLQAHLEPIVRATSGATQFFVAANVPVISTSDFYESYIQRLLALCFLQVDPAEQVRWLNCWKANLERSISQPTSAFKIDGSLYHHGSHYHSYAQGMFLTFTELVGTVRPTPWRLFPQAHASLRRSMLAQRFYANRFDIPLSLRGRSPFANGYGLILPYGVDTMEDLALLGTPDGSESVDREVAGMYLRFNPAAAGSPPYSTMGITPEPEPNGSFVMPYAGLLTHRRDNWMVSIKGQSKYVWGSEREDRRNAYGLFMGLGNLEIFAGGTPVSALGSGCNGLGWDWGRFEGTTVPHLPLAKLDAGWTRTDAVTRSGESFMGGLSHKGRQGSFSMIMNETIMPAPGKILRGKKSWFFMEDRILCLGSGITCDESQYPTETILCQKDLRTGGQGPIPATTVDGASVTAFPVTQTLNSSQAHSFIDVQQTGYYVPAGQNVVVARQSQASRDVDDLVVTNGDFLTAWINHGLAPSGASYEYMLLVRATSQTLANVVAAPPYRVLQRDDSAHIIWDIQGNRWSCSLFAAQSIAAHLVGAETLPLKAVDRPCLVMADTVQAGHLDLSVTDPDLNLVGGVNQSRPLRITVRGAWRVSTATGSVCAWTLPGVDQKVRVVSSSATETVLEITCEHGASYDISLVP